MILRVLLSVIVGSLWVSFRSFAAEKDEPAECLVISDIHFNPFLHPDLFAALSARPATEWAGILDASLSGAVSQYGSDSNYPLVKSAFAAAAKFCPQPDFILFAGDSLAHNWRSQYDKLASRSSHEDPAAYRSFTAKTIAFLALEFQRYFPRIPVLPTIGNEDAYCGDYEIQPAGPFLEMFARVWMALPGEAVAPAAFQAQFSRGGHYSAVPPSLPQHRIVVLNSVFFSNQYQNTCGSDSETPGDDEMAWLAAELESARRAGEKVWLVMHIPVGINDYNTVKDEEARSEPAEFWRRAYSGQFVDLVEEFKDTFQLAFSGHTHMDDFRVIERDGTPLALNKLVPSISPIFRNNPGFQIYFFDRRTGAIRDYSTYYLSNLSSAGKPTDFERVEWEHEYDFGPAYRMPSLDVASVASIAHGLKKDPSLRSLYRRFYSVSGPPGFDEETLSVYSCALLHTTLEEFEKCQQASGGDAR